MIRGQQELLYRHEILAMSVSSLLFEATGQPCSTAIILWRRERNWGAPPTHQVGPTSWNCTKTWEASISRLQGASKVSYEKVGPPSGASKVADEKFGPLSRGF